MRTYSAFPVAASGATLAFYSLAPYISKLLASAASRTASAQASALSAAKTTQ